MRKLIDHKVNGLNDAIDIEVMDEPGSGGACHEYLISLKSGEGVTSGNHIPISFQNGPIKESGFNGISGEALLAVVIDRMRGFQSGPYSCRENSIALTKAEECLLWLNKRTQDRMKRGVEGTHSK